MFYCWPVIILVQFKAIQIPFSPRLPIFRALDPDNKLLLSTPVYTWTYKNIHIAGLPTFYSDQVCFQCHYKHFVANSVQAHGRNYGRKIGHSLHSLLRLHDVAFYDDWIVSIILDWIWDMCCENLNAITRSGLLKVEGIGTELAVQSTRLNKAL